MAAETTHESAEWQPSPLLTDDSVISPEHVALVDFACRLGAFTTNDEPGIADARDVRQQANLLMSLLSFPPHLVSDDLEHHSLSSASAAAPGDQHYLSDASTSSATTSSSQHRRESFRFSHPALSLDCKWQFPHERPLKTPCTAPDKAEGESEASPPAVLLGRALKVDDREAHRLSADAMARNLLQSFQKAIKWRIQAWMDTLSESLVEQEAALVRQNATEEEIRELLKTGEAQLYMRLRQAAQSIEVQHAETCFHVLPQRSQRENHEDTEAPLGKRRRIESEDSELRTGEAEYQYSVCHALEFDGTIHLNTPAGHSEITLEVPGFIEGTFLSSEPGMEDLTAVEVEIDTNILASMVEKSCRLIVRSSVEHMCKQQQQKAATAASTEEDTEEPIKTAEDASRYPRFQGTTPIGSGPSPAAIVTPRSNAAPFLAGSDAEHGFLQIPEDLDTVKRQPRRISPQPNSPEMMASAPFNATPSTPSKRERDTLPSMVSPAPKEAPTETRQEDAYMLATKEEESHEKGQNLPVLVEVACAAMQAKTGWSGQ